MRSLPSYGFWLSAGLALIVACEPDLDPLSAEFGFGGKSNSGGAGGVAGLSNTGGETRGGNGSGGAVITEGGSENTGGVSPEGGMPGTDPCTDLVLGVGESDVDCGGPSACARCAVGAACTVHTDCATAVCLDGKCATPSCADGIQNQNETGLDCGGMCAAVSPCEDGEACKSNSDCASEFCLTKVCTDHCSSRRKDADETGVDCGGPVCGPCPNDSACGVNADCVSGVCSNKVCVPPSCTDRLKNQDEPDIDCGGICTAAGKQCALSAKCVKGSDCDSNICTSSTCVADITIPPEDIIDNMEDGNLILPTTGGRAGNWYPFGDGTGTLGLEMFPLNPKRSGSGSALHFVSNGFKTWGSGMGFDFNNTGGMESTKTMYNASAYTGITFWGRAGAAVGVPIQFADINTHKNGGKCTTCDHYWGALVPFTTDWQRFIVRWSDLQLEPGNVPAPTAFDSANIIAFQCFLTPGKNVDLWIDDIAFIK